MDLPARARRAARRAAPRRGAATLVVVMVLFFIVSLVAAYASRNLIFEQKTSSNQMRSTQAFEAAEAGIEWALAQLNSGRATGQCLPSTATGDGALRERYLAIDAASGLVAIRGVSGGGSAEPACVLDTRNDDPNEWRWFCRCPPIDATPSAFALTSPRPAPAFALRFCNATATTDPECIATTPPVGTRPGVVRIDSNGCTRLDDDCLRFGSANAAARGQINEGVASVQVIAALRSALPAPPAAALTLHGTLSLSGVQLTLDNVSAARGLTLHQGQGDPATPPASPPDLVLLTAPGTPGAASYLGSDPMLAQAALPAASMADGVALGSADRFFVAFFGVKPATYLRQPAMIEIRCDSACVASTINARAALNPGRMLWLRGSGGLTIDADIGSVAAPVLLVVEGDVTANATATFSGLIYGRNAGWSAGRWDWSLAGNPTIVGAVLGEGDLRLSGAGNATIRYDAAVLETLRRSHGSFVRVPGGWRDFGVN